MEYILILFVYRLYFFKQMTANEMRMSDRSSDVCSTDLGRRPHDHHEPRLPVPVPPPPAPPRRVRHHRGTRTARRSALHRPLRPRHRPTPLRAPGPTHVRDDPRLPPAPSRTTPPPLLHRQLTHPRV